MPEKNREEAVEALALKILRSARARLLLKMKYLDRALVRLPLRPTDEWKIACDGETLFFDPGYVLIRFREDETFALRVWLHVLMHWLFAHSLVGEDTDPDYWDLASDLFAEQLTASVCPEELASPQQNYRRQELAKFCGGIRPLTAEGIYRRLLDDPPDPHAFRELKELVSLDDHRIWRGAAGAEKSGASKKGRKQGALSALGDLDETAPDASSGEAEGTAGIWKRLASEMESELISASRRAGDRSGDFVRAITDHTSRRTDYREFLRKFATRSEVLAVSREEFDYIFYTYGLELYGDTPLVEPLEYREDRKIRDFVIVIDTSGSVSGELVQRFLMETFSVLETREAFRERFCLHILQCDAAVKQDDVVRNRREMEAYLRTVQLRGFGGTDFRPAFSYVDGLIRERKIRDLKGLLYFTDGLGTFPEKKPPYLTAFVFADPDSHALAKTPPWAVTAVLSGSNMTVYEPGR